VRRSQTGFVAGRGPSQVRNWRSYSSIVILVQSSCASSVKPFTVRFCRQSTHSSRIVRRWQTLGSSRLLMNWQAARATRSGTGSSKKTIGTATCGIACARAQRTICTLWTKAAMKGIGPAVIGSLAISLLQLAPHAIPDLFAIVILVATIVALLVWRDGAVKLMVAGSILGVLRSRLFSLGAKAAL
jgi:hypothetical protein